MKIYTNWAFLRPVLHLPLWWLYYRKPSFSMYLLSTQEHTIPLCVKILQILFQLELSWFWIEGNGRFWDFLTFYVPLCSKKLSVQCMATLYFAYWKTVGNQLAAVVMKVKLTSFYYSVLSFGSYALVLLFREQNKRYISRLFFRAC